MSSVRILFVAIAGFCAAGCTQVSSLGQAEGAEGAEGATSSSEASSESSATSFDSDTSSGLETGSESESAGEETGEETSEEAGDEESGDTDGPLPEACDIVDLGGNEGVTLEVSPMTDWEEGACHTLYLTNEGPENVIWTRDLRFGGMLDNHWNVVVEQLSPTDWRFRGQANADNIALLSGSTISFGACMKCIPEDPP